MEIFETPLPGLGVRYEFTTQAGDAMGVVVRRDGQRELVLYDAEDPDTCRASLRLQPDEASALVEIFGGSKVTERLADLRHQVEGLAIDWITLPESGGLTGRTIGDGEVRTRSGASIVAIIRGGTSMPGPDPDLELQAGDVALVMGTAAGVDAAARLLTD